MFNQDLAKRFSLYTIYAVYFLILVGGIVRSWGAGMGCPDWPKCFGSYVPPTAVEDLPEGYESYYVQSRVRKNKRLASVLDYFGFNELSARVMNDPNIGATTIFDPEKAWVEYINRLIGVTIGIFVILNMVFSFSFKKVSRFIPALGIIAFVLVVIQGWIGSLVVSTNLLPGFITIHMVLALILVMALLGQYFLMQKEKTNTVLGNKFIALLLVLFSIQIILGTQVREVVDSLNYKGIIRSNWINELGTLFYIHRSYSILIVLVSLWIFYRNYRSGVKSPLVFALLGVLSVEILLGITVAYFEFPAFAQPIHLFLGTLAFGVIFYLFLQANFKRIEV